MRAGFTIKAETNKSSNILTYLATGAGGRAAAFSYIYIRFLTHP